MAVYTKRGDRGKTDLFDPKNGKKIRVLKNDQRLQIIGTIDELNSVLGVVKCLLLEKNDISLIEKIQKDLFLVNSNVAGVKGINFSKSKVSYLEKKIDLLEEKLPKLTNFILPGGNTASSFFHLARCITRRAERNIVTFSKDEKFNENILMYINRLSDLFFTLARWQNFSNGKKETDW